MVEKNEKDITDQLIDEATEVTKKEQEKKVKEEIKKQSPPEKEYETFCLSCCERWSSPESIYREHWSQDWSVCCRESPCRHDWCRDP